MSAVRILTIYLEENKVSLTILIYKKILDGLKIQTL